jgi:purine-binding chemotaxis protein CheW
MSESEQFCTLFIGEYRCAVSVLSVLEVLSCQRLTPIPLAPSTVAGLLNLRGQILTVLDLRASLLDPGYQLSESPMILVLERDGQPLAFLVDAIGDVIRPSSDELLPPPETIPPRLRRLTAAVIHQGDLITLVFDAERVAQAGCAA